MLLYHISVDQNHTGEFQARIPEVRMDSENDWIERVCFAKTIEGCFSSIPAGASRLEEYNEEVKGEYRLFILDTEKAGISPEQIIDTDTIYESGWVDDADITGEVWITQDVQATSVRDVILESWHEELRDVIPYVIYEKAEEEYDGDYCECYMDEVDDFVPCMVLITNAVFKEEAGV